MKRYIKELIIFVLQLCFVLKFAYFDSFVLCDNRFIREPIAKPTTDTIRYQTECINADSL